MLRRQLLSRLCALLAWVAAGALAWPVLRFVTWRPRTHRDVVFKPEEQAPMASREGVCLVDGEDGLVALDMRCTHLCCTVTFDEDRGVFCCPCHGSVYDRSGRRIRGPAHEDLRRLPAERSPDGALVVRAPA